MKLITINPNNEPYYSEDFIKGFKCGAQRQFEADKADRPQGDVDAVAIFEREMHNLEQGYITIGEFDERIEPLRHLCYGRPQGEWIDGGLEFEDYECSECGYITEKINNKYLYDYCPWCGADMKGTDDE